MAFSQGFMNLPTRRANLLLRRVAALFRVFFGLVFRVCLRIGENGVPNQQSNHAPNMKKPLLA